MTALLIGLLIQCFPLPAQALTSLKSVTVMADNSMSVAIATIARHYSRDRQIIVNTAFTPQSVQEAQITEGAAADILITPKELWIEQLKTRGLIDIYSPTPVAGLIQPASLRYFAVVIAGDNMDEARKFLEYLKSDDAKQVFRENGFSVD